MKNSFKTLICCFIILLLIVPKLVIADVGNFESYDNDYDYDHDSYIDIRDYMNNEKSNHTNTREENIIAICIIVGCFTIPPLILLLEKNAEKRKKNGSKNKKQFNNPVNDNQMEIKNEENIKFNTVVNVLNDELKAWLERNKIPSDEYSKYYIFLPVVVIRCSKSELFNGDRRFDFKFPIYKCEDGKIAKLYAWIYRCLDRTDGDKKVEWDDSSSQEIDFFDNKKYQELFIQFGQVFALFISLWEKNYSNEEYGIRIKKLYELADIYRKELSKIGTYEFMYQLEQDDNLPVINEHFEAYKDKIHEEKDDESESE